MIKLTFASTLNDQQPTPFDASPSWFAVRSLEGFTTATDVFSAPRFRKQSTFTQVEESAQHCWRCGGYINHSSNKGYSSAYKVGAKFNDHWECVGRNNEHKVICAACEAVSDRAYHPNFNLTALYTGSKAYQLTKDEDLMSFLLNPPPPPYLFCMAENNSQHMVWLSRYTLDNRLLAITKGRSSGVISREQSFSLAKRYCHLLETANTIRAAREKQALATPFKSSRMDINKSSSTNLEVSLGIKITAQVLKNDPDGLEPLINDLTLQIAEIEATPFCYLTWFVAAMFVKAILTDFEPKDISEWPLMKKPTTSQEKGTNDDN